MPDDRKGRKTEEFSPGLGAKPRATGQQPASAPRATHEVPAQRPLQGKTGGQPAAAAGRPAPAKALTATQKQQQSSGFGASTNEAMRKVVMGAPPKIAHEGASFADDEEDEPTAFQQFDGSLAPEELTLRDVWKAVQAPLQSREGRRSGALYEAVIKQFAVATNPRYEPDTPEQPRGHIFVWDATRAMNCEIPHFVGARELTLAQTCDWLRHEGPMRGWQRVAPEDIYTLASGGQVVVAMPKEVRLKALALVYPQDAADKPKVAGAGRKRGWGLSLLDVLGVASAEYFTHA